MQKTLFLRIATEKENSLQYPLDLNRAYSNEYIFQNENIFY